MRKALWFIVIILMIATFSDHPKILPYKEALFDLLSSEAQNATKSSGGQSLRQVKRDLMALSRDMGTGQQQELERITADLDTLHDFYKTYCLDQQFNPLFYGDGIKDICMTISRQRIALNF